MPTVACVQATIRSRACNQPFSGANFQKTASTYAYVGSIPNRSLAPAVASACSTRRNGIESPRTSWTHCQAGMARLRRAYVVHKARLIWVSAAARRTKMPAGVVHGSTNHERAVSIAPREITPKAWFSRWLAT